MIFLMFTCLSVWSDPVDLTTYAETGVYSRLQSRDVAVAPDGEVYVIDFEEKQIVHFGPDGQLIQRFGRKGQGPGEFNFPNSIQVFDDAVFVGDQGKSLVLEFDRKGVFRRDHRVPGRFTMLRRTSHGWLSIDPNNPMTEDPIRLVVSDADMGSEKVLGEWARKNSGGNISVEANGNEIPKIPYNPAPRRASFALSPDGRYAAFIENSEFEIHVFDLERAEKTGVLSREITPVPFNREWGMERLADANDNRPGGGIQIEFEANFPEYFPAVRSLAFSPDGLLVATLWTGAPDKVVNRVVLDPAGNERKLLYPEKAHDRVVGILGDHAYVTGFDAEREEAEIYRCAVRDVGAVIEAHPIVDVEVAPRFMIRTEER
jgi:hypothetical protein